MNIQEVAKRAAVSTATVSRTINGSDKVAPKTAERVRQAIKELNFYPNTNARALGSGRSRLYGLIISDITNPFFPELMRSFEEIAVESGQEVIVANTGYDPKRTEMCVRRMLERKVDGVAIMTSEMSEHMVERLGQNRIPMVFLDTGVAGRATSNILLDYSRGINAAVSHLAGLGHKRIGFISGPKAFESTRMRTGAFLHALGQHGIAIRDEDLQEGNNHIDGGNLAMERLLQSEQRPTAIHGQGLTVPRDFSVMGFDDIEISASIYPALTTIRLSRWEIASCAFRALYAASYDRELEGSEYRITPELIVRESTAPPCLNCERR